MFRLGLLFITILFFIGCTTKKEDSLLKSYTEKIDYHKQLQKTEKIQLYENNETKFVLIATHMYTQNFEKNDTRDEVFIVGIDIEDSNISSKDIINMLEVKNTNDNITLKNKKRKKRKKIPYGLTLNGKKAIEVKELNHNDKRLDNLSFLTEWGSYYLVTYKHIKSKRLNLVFKHKEYGKGKLHFSKVAKYVFTKKGF